VKAGDLIVEAMYPNDPPGMIVQVGNELANQPYKVWCPYFRAVIEFGPKYVHEECEVISEGR
jgi:hypothetical protein